MNADGQLNQNEYTSLSVQINQPEGVNASTPSTFVKIDSDGNGTISKTEFDGYVATQKK